MGLFKAGSIMVVASLSLMSCGGSGGGGSSSSSVPVGGPVTPVTVTNTITSVQLVGTADAIVTAVGTGYDGATPSADIADGDSTVDAAFDITFDADGSDVPADPGATGSVDLYMEVDLDDGADNLLIPVTIEPSY